MPCQRNLEMKKEVEQDKKNHIDRAQPVTVAQFVSELMSNYVSESRPADDAIQRRHADRTEYAAAQRFYADRMEDTAVQRVHAGRMVDAAGHGYHVGKTEDIMAHGYHAGWLEEQDITGKNALLDRKTAARILHQFMRIEMHEADEENTDSALKLQDLYDCRRCVGHVMQVYVKGIMDGHIDPAGRCIFGMKEGIPADEVQEIVRRLFQVNLREARIQETKTIRRGERITDEEALQYLQVDKHAKLIDVRPEYEFLENHLDGSQSIPLSAILKNPYIVSDRRDHLILLYCEQGYKSEIAANCLVDAGYERVCYFAWESL